MDWPVLLQIVTLLTGALTAAFTAWIALRQQEVRLRVDELRYKTDSIYSQAEDQSIRLNRQGQKMDVMATTINGHLAKLVESQLDVGRLKGIQEEQVRMKEKTQLALAEKEEADARAIAVAEKLAVDKIALAREVAQKLESVRKGQIAMKQPLTPEGHEQLTDAAHEKVQELADETKPEK